MFKKLIIAGAILAATSSLAFAGAAPYVGVGVGADTAKAETKLYDSSGNPVFKNDTGLAGVMGNAFVGFGGTVAQNIYLAGEVFGDVSSSKGDFEIISLPTADVKLTLKRQYGYGASFIPGVFITDHTMLYARAGVVRSHFKAEAKDYVSGSSDSSTENRTGGQFGVGLQAWFAQNLAARLEYNYTTYGSFTRDDEKFNVITNQATLGLVYCFG